MGSGRWMYEQIALKNWPAETGLSVWALRRCKLRNHSRSQKTNTDGLPPLTGTQMRLCAAPWSLLWEMQRACAHHPPGPPGWWCYHCLPGHPSLPNNCLEDRAMNTSSGVGSKHPLIALLQHPGTVPWSDRGTLPLSKEILEISLQSTHGFYVTKLCFSTVFKF